MKKILFIVLIGMLLQPIAVFAQISSTDETEINQFCSNKNSDGTANEQGILLRKNVTAVNQFCANTHTCVELVDAVYEVGEAKKALVNERDQDKKTKLNAAITKFEEIVVAKQKTCGDIEDLLVADQRARAAAINTTVAEMATGSNGEFIGCARLDQADTSVKECAREDSKFNDLQNAILTGSLVTLLEEPIGQQDVFDRARICELDFVRDNKGELQKVEDTSNRYAIRPAECRTYIVADCKPSRSNLSSITIEGKVLKDGNEVVDHLPLVVYCDRVQAIWADSGVNLLKKYVGLVYSWVVGIVGVIAVLVIMASGIQISASNGDSAKIDEAKGRIIQSIVALAVLFLSGIILYAINPTFFMDGDPSAAPEEREVDMADVYNPEGLDEIERAMDEVERDQLYDDR